MVIIITDQFINWKFITDIIFELNFTFMLIFQIQIHLTQIDYFHFKYQSLIFILNNLSFHFSVSFLTSIHFINSNYFLYFQLNFEIIYFSHHLTFFDIFFPLFLNCFFYFYSVFPIHKHN